MADQSGTSVVSRLAQALRHTVVRFAAGALDFLRRVATKARQDDIFFLAGGIAFFAVIAAIPFLLLLVAIFGFVLQATMDDPAQVAVDYVISILPATRSVVETTRGLVDDIIAGRTRFGLLGLGLFVWFSTSLIGSLRSALRDVFDLQEERNILWGKLFDAIMVFVAGSLFVINTGITIGLEAVQIYGLEWFGIDDEGGRRLVGALWAQAAAFFFIFLMFVLIYRYLPARRIPWRISLVAATFTAITWELIKALFTWYVSSYATYTTTYGTLATLIVIAFWIYYSAVVFVLGGEVGQVYEMYRIRRRQREMLE